MPQALEAVHKRFPVERPPRQSVAAPNVRLLTYRAVSTVLHSEVEDTLDMMTDMKVAHFIYRDVLLERLRCAAR